MYVPKGLNIFNYMFQTRQALCLFLLERKKILSQFSSFSRSAFISLAIQQSRILVQTSGHTEMPLNSLGALITAVPHPLSSAATACFLRASSQAVNLSASLASCIRNVVTHKIYNAYSRFQAKLYQLVIESRKEAFSPIFSSLAANYQSLDNSTVAPSYSGDSGLKYRIIVIFLRHSSKCRDNRQYHGRFVQHSFQYAIYSSLKVECYII